MNWLRRFMVGRYGTDQLNVFLILTALVLEMVGMFVARGLLTLVALAVLIWSITRTFSRNLDARRCENAKYLRMRQRIRGFFAGISARIRDRKTHRIYKCPSCGQKVRVPKGRGRIRITCPKCGHKFDRTT